MCVWLIACICICEKSAKKNNCKRKDKVEEKKNVRIPDLNCDKRIIGGRESEKQTVIKREKK